MSNVRGRLNRLERDVAAVAARSQSRTNVFDVLLQLLLGEVALDDVDPEDRPIVERLYRSQIRGESESASSQSSQGPADGR